jgi:3'(2'), 5'-bisphosphate nucleotidase
MGNLADDDPKLTHVLDDLYAHYENPGAWCVAPGAEDAFASLRSAGVKVAVISNWDTRLPKLLRDCGFDESLIDTVIVSAEQMSDKPDRKIFDVALERLGLVGSAHVVAHVGDSSVNDVDGSRDAGFGASLLWTSSLGAGRAFDFGEIAEEILASRE